MEPASSKEFLDIQGNYRLWMHSETRTSHDNDIQSVKSQHYGLKLFLLVMQIVFFSER